MYNLHIVRHYVKGDGDCFKSTVEMDGEVLREFEDTNQCKGYVRAISYVDAFYDLFGTDEVKVTEDMRGYDPD